jgi:hypothetical protein
VRGPAAHHRQPLQPEAEGPAAVGAVPAVVENALLDHAAAEDLHPLTIEEDLELP